jgi:hypothetical protein
MGGAGASAPKGGRQFLFLIAVLAALFYLFVWKQWALVASPAAFFFLVFLLIFIAFCASASEAAFTLVTGSEAFAAIFAEITKRQNELASELAPIDEKDSIHLSSEEEKQRGKILAKSRRLGIKRRALNGEMRDEFVGALSAFSVFLNTALAAFLPFTLIGTSNSPLIRIPYLFATFENQKLVVTSAEYALVAPGLLIFFSSAIPVLILGKIVPKMVGFRNPKFFAYDHYWFGRCIHITLGWIAIGAKWAFSSAAGSWATKKAT